MKSLKVTFPELRAIVTSNDKQRFSLIPISEAPSATAPETPAAPAPSTDTSPDAPAPPAATSPDDASAYLIRANQGHSISSVSAATLLTPLTASTPDLPAVCVHGTTAAAWPAILASGGLRPMGRNHVHLAAGLPAGFEALEEDGDDGEPAQPVISGMRSSSRVLVYVDLARAMAAGVVFYRSANNVILTEGDAERKVLGVEFFKRVEDRKAKAVLVRDGVLVGDAGGGWLRAPERLRRPLAREALVARDPDRSVPGLICLLVCSAPAASSFRPKRPHPRPQPEHLRSQPQVPSADRGSPLSLSFSLPDTPAMQSKPAHPPPDDAAAAAQRKRKQNRISQQCLREKKAAMGGGPALDRLGADMRALRDGCERTGQVDAARLLAVSEGLVDENRALREALLRMRKKLLSLSGAADSAADDPIFQKMLAKEAAEATPAGGTGGASKRRKCSSASGRAGAARFGSSDAAGDALAPGHRDGSPGDEAFVDLHAESSESGASSSAGCQRLDPRLQGPAAHAASPAVDLSQLFQTTTSTAAREACPGFPGTAKTPQELCNAFAIPIAGLPQISLPNHAVLDAWMSRSYANFLSQKIENACIQYALRSRSCKVERGAAVEQMIEKSMVERLAEIAVHMMFDDVGLGRFINMLEGAREFLKSVVTCRIMLGCAKPPDLPDELDTECPPWATSTRPLVVDMIAWPSLRDQMIFHSSFYDLDEMTEDVINMTVVDVPEQQIALKMYNPSPKPYPDVPRPEDAEKPFKFSQQEYTLRILQIQNRDLCDIIARRMDCTVNPCSDLQGSSPSPCITAKTDKRFKGWKLSSAFFRKYPFLQCSSLASSYPVYPSSQAPGY
ncbi:putative tRNA 2 -phosphotransferase 1 protein [Neofusicoccum parvum]|nr:putative tRNA 2 -phosphotransferase 1 protein [Neofusicoccum parvum]